MLVVAAAEQGRGGHVRRQAARSGGRVWPGGSLVTLARRPPPRAPVQMSLAFAAIWVPYRPVMFPSSLFFLLHRPVLILALFPPPSPSASPPSSPPPSTGLRFSLFPTTQYWSSVLPLPHHPVLVFGSPSSPPPSTGLRFSLFPTTQYWFSLFPTTQYWFSLFPTTQYWFSIFSTTQYWFSLLSIT